jgi:hypothetical protein
MQLPPIHPPPHTSSLSRSDGSRSANRLLPDFDLRSIFTTAITGNRVPGVGKGYLQQRRRGCVCWFLAGWARSAELELALEGWHDFGVSQFSASRGLDGLERAGLFAGSKWAGRPNVVTIRQV